MYIFLYNVEYLESNLSKLLRNHNKNNFNSSENYINESSTILQPFFMSLILSPKFSDTTSSKIGADEIGNLFIQTLNSYVRGLSLKIDSFWQKKSCAKIPRKFSTHHAFDQPARDMRGKENIRCRHSLADRRKCHSSEIRGLRLTKSSSETLQNLLYFMYKKTHVVFFVFHFVQLYIFTL